MLPIANRMPLQGYLPWRKLTAPVRKLNGKKSLAIAHLTPLRILTQRGTAGFTSVPQGNPV